MEYHILIAWHKAEITTQKILETLPPNFLVNKIFMYKWDIQHANKNYAAFYGEKLEDIQYKVDHCGKGSFRVFLLEDLLPKYEARSTSSGLRIVNVNLFDFKAKLRELTGGGHLIHASDTKTEADLNCMALFGLLPIEVANGNYDYNNTGIIYIERNITGALGWNSWSELLKTLNRLTDYIVLRNAETITDDLHEIHGDTDLLVRDFHTAITVCACQKEAIGKERVYYSVLINGIKQFIDFRYVGDNYYDARWEQYMLNQRIQIQEEWLFVPDKDNYDYSILYHALVHKPFISPDYLNFLKLRFGTENRESLNTILNDFIVKRGYRYTKPKDNTVFIHPDFYAKIDISTLRKIVNSMKVIKYKRGGHERDNQWSKKISKMLYRGYYMGISALRKIKASARKTFHH